MKKKYYAVAVGRRCGIYTDWSSAEAQVKSFAGAKYQSFPSREEAEAWLLDPVYQKKERSSSEHASAETQPKQRPGAITVFTDGGCINNPGPGGYGIVIEENGDRREMSGGFRLTTNNRMEMMAAIVALETLWQCRTPIDLFSDSSYMVNGITKGWARKWRNNGWCKADGGAVLNVDLWRQLLLLVESLDVRFHWLKGHAGNEGNERCDTLAVAAARQAELPDDEGYRGLESREGAGFE
ncbi:MAG: ribonuclease HI [Pseudomonadota bacterium]